MCGRKVVPTVCTFNFEYHLFVVGLRFQIIPVSFSMSHAGRRYVFVRCLQMLPIPFKSIRVALANGFICGFYFMVSSFHSGLLNRRKSCRLHHFKIPSAVYILHEVLKNRLSYSNIDGQLSKINTLNNGALLVDYRF